MLKVKISWLLPVLLGVIVFGAGCSSYEYKGAVLDPPMAVPDFELTDTNNQPFHLSDVKGDIALIYFGYTFCPDVCPLTLWDVKQALADFEGKNRVKVIFVSVDPERDTPDVLAKYLSGFDPEYIGLTDDFEKVEAVMKPFGAFAEKEDVEGSAAGYLVNHTARLYLLTPEQELMLMYPFGFEPEDLRSDLTHLLQD